MAFGKKSEKKAGGKRGKLPVKRSINLAMTDEKPVNLKVGIPAFILILVAAFAFGKFAVADRLLEVSRAEAEVAALRSELNAAYDRLNSFGELTEIYAHYTYSGMTQLTLNFVCDDLRVVNRTVQDIESDPHVNFCTVNTAATNDNYNNIYADGGVNARIMVYLNPAEEVTRP